MLESAATEPAQIERYLNLVVQKRRIAVKAINVPTTFLTPLGVTNKPSLLALMMKMTAKVMNDLSFILMDVAKIATVKSEDSCPLCLNNNHRKYSSQLKNAFDTLLTFSSHSVTQTQVTTKTFGWSAVRQAMITRIPCGSCMVPSARS
jgi:dihydropteroate synthase